MTLFPIDIIMTSIEVRIDDIIKDLEQHKETHPVFVKVWTLYLREKFNNLSKMLTQCEKISNSDLSNTPDLDPTMLASLVTMF